jgi:hypothetical protein
MPARPSFTSVQLTNGTLQVLGISDTSEPPGNDILDIRVVLTQPAAAQGEPPRIASGSVAELSPAWQANLPAQGFAPGPAVAFGVETRRTNAKTTTWVEPIEIE